MSHSAHGTFELAPTLTDGCRRAAVDVELLLPLGSSGLLIQVSSSDVVLSSPHILALLSVNAKHIAAIGGSRGADAQQQNMVQKFAGAICRFPGSQEISGIGAEAFDVGDAVMTIRKGNRLIRIIYPHVRARPKRSSRSPGNLLPHVVEETLNGRRPL